jgi:hypothetical protein
MAPNQVDDSYAIDVADIDKNIGDLAGSLQLQ